MALGTNIEYKASALFQATMDEKSAKETEKRFVELSKKAAEMSREEFELAFKNLGEVINKSLSKLKIAPIDMNQIIKLPQADAFSKLGTEFGARFANGFQGVVSGNISTSVQEEIKRLEAERDKLLSLQKRIPKRIERYEYLAGVDSVEKGDVKAFSLDDIKNMSNGGTADELASKLRSEYDALSSSLNNLDRNTKEYGQTLVKTYEAAFNLYRMRATMDKHPNLVTNNDVLFDYDYESLNTSIGEYLVDNKHSKAFAQYIESQEELLDKIPKRLLKIEQQLNNIQQSNPEIINKEEANTGLKTLNEIEAAYQRILNAHKKVGKQGRNIQDALSFDPATSKEGLQSLYKNVTQMPEDAPWEVQYQALLKYVKLYESYLNSDNSTHRNKVTKPYNEFTTLYEQLKPLAANAENMLRNVLNMAENKPLVGMGGAEADSVGGNVTDTNIVSDNISEQNQLVQQYNANKEKTLALLKKEQLSYEEILYLVKEVQTEYAKSFFSNKNYDLGDDAISLMTSVYGKLRRGDMIDPRLDKAINGVGISAEDGARILADYQNKQVGVAGSDDSEIDVNAETKARVEAEAKARADAEQAKATEREKTAQEAVAEAERKALENTKLNLALKQELVSATQQQMALIGEETDAKESMRLLGENGVLSTVQGQDFMVDAKTMVTQLASNLKNSIVMSLHDHPNAMDMFTPDDVNTFAKLYYGQGVKVNGIIANGVIKTIDFTGISQDIAIKIGQSFSENLSRAAQQSGLFTYQDKNIIPVEEVQSWMSSDPEKYEQAMDGIRDLVDASLNDAFKQNGVESTLQQFKKNQLPELTQQLLKLQQSGENAVAPIEKLKNLLVTIKPNHGFDWSNYADVLDQFEKGSLNGMGAVNKILAQINAETQAQEHLNQATNQTPPAQDNTGIHHANADAIEKEALTQEQLAEKIKKTQSLMKNQQAWLNTLDPYLNDANYKTSGKREATDQLRSAVSRMVSYRKNPDEYAYEQMAEEKRIVDWYKAYQEAQKQGVADSVLEKNHIGVYQSEYDNALAALQKERDYRAQALVQLQDLLQQQLDAQNKLNVAKAQEPSTTDDVPKLQDENTKLDEQNNKLKENINLKAQANGQGVATDIGTSGTATTPTQTIPNGVPSAEITELEAVRTKVAEITDAVNAKTEAFKNEENVVQSVVANEINHLTPLKEVLETISALINNIKSNNNIDAGLSNIVVNVNHTDTQQNDYSQVIDAISKINIQPAPVTDIGNVLATENTLNAIKTTVESINNKVKQGTRVETVSNEPIEDNGKEMVLYNAEPDSQFSGGGSKKPTEKIKTALTALLKYKTTLQEANQLSGDLETGINSLYAELSQVSDKDELMIWNEHFKQFKNASSIVQTLVKDYQELGALQAKADAETDPTKLAHYLDNIEILQDRINTKSVDVNVGDDRFEEARQRAYNITQHELQQRQELASATLTENEALAKQEKTFHKLIAATSLYNQMLIGAEKAKTSEEKSAYTQNAEAALAEQEKLLQSITLTKEQQAEFDELEIERTRQLALIKAKKTGRENQIHNAQVEAEVVKQLVKLYEKLGKAQYLKDNKEATNIRQQIGTERAKLSSIDYSTDMKFKAAKEKGFNAEQTKAKTEAENKALNKRKQVIAELIKLYEQYAQLSVRAGFADGKNLSDQLNAEAEEIYQQITDTEKLLGSISSEEKQEFFKAMDKGIAREESSQLEKVAKSIDKDEADRLKELGKEYEKLGKLQARADLADGEYEKKYLKDLVESQQEIIRLKQQGLNIDKSLYDTKYIKAYEKEVDDLNIKIARQKDKADKASFKDAIKQSQKDAGVSKAGSLVNKATSTLGEAMQIEGLTPDKVALLERFNNEVLELNSQYQEASRKDTLVTPEQEQALKAQAQNVDKLTKEVNELIAEYQRLSGDNATVIGANSIIGDANINEYKKQLTDAVMAATNGKAKITEFDASTKTLHYTVKTGSHEFTEYAASVRHLDNSLVALQGSTKKTETFLEGIRRKTKEIFMYLGGSSTIYRAFAEIKKGIQYVREIDSALTELKKVTDETEETYDRFLQTAAKTADKVGSTIKEVVSSTADFARLGYTLKDAAQMAESAQLLMNVSEFTDISSATDTLISAMQAFGYSAEESLHVVDIFNTIGNSYAISTADLADSLTRSSAALVAAGNSLEQASALTVAGNTILQDPESVGNALKVVSMRIRGTASELEAAGEETEGLVENTSKLQAQIQAMTGVNILDDTGAYKDTFTILYEIGKVWENLDDMSQAALLEKIAGKTRGSAVAAILQNYELLEEAYNSAMEAEGSALKENEKYLSSIQGRIDLFNNSVQTMWSNALDSDVIKGVVDLGTHLVKIVDTLGLIPSILIAIATYKLAASAIKMFNIPDIVSYVNMLFMAKTATDMQGISIDVLNFKQKLLNSTLIQAQMVRMGLTAADIAGYSATQLLTLGVQGLIAGFKNLFVAMGPVGWAILGVTAALTAGIAIFNKINISAEEASETLKETKDNISNLESELKSLDTQLDETRDKIAELTALPSLSLVQQEELDKLKEEVELLEKKKKLQERQLATEEAQLITDTETVIEKSWNNQGQYYTELSGEIKEDSGWSGFWHNSKPTNDILNEAIEKYEKRKNAITEAENLLADWDNPKEGKDISSFVYDTLWVDSDSPYRATAEQLQAAVTQAKETNNRVFASIDDVLSNPDYTGLSYGMSDEIDAFLDEYNQIQLKWEKALYGDASKANAIEDLWGSNSTEEMKKLKSEIDAIMATDDDWDSKNTSIMEHLKGIDETAKGYEQLKFVMDELDITSQDIADYFTVLNGEFNSFTIEGITKQYSKATEVINKFKDGLSVEGIDSDGNKVLMNFDDLFTFDDKTNKWQADSNKISQILKETDERTRKQFLEYITHIKNAQQEAIDAGKDFDITEAFAQTSKNIEIDGLLRVIDITKESLSSINQVTFKGVANEINGLIDTFDEFGKALEDTASAMDTIYKAQKQMNSSGRISVKTALELMQSTEDWNSVLEINGDTITLQDKAEQSLIQSRLNLIEQNINTALSEAELQYAKLEGADATLLQGDADLATVEAQKEFDKAMNQSAAVSAGLGAAAGNLIEKLKALANLDFDSSAWNTSMTGAFNTAYTSALTVLDKQTNPESAEEVKQRINDLRAQKDMIGQLKKNPSAFKNYYDYDETPGDKYDDDGSDDALDKLREKYERQIENLDNQQTYLQNEIDRLEAENKAVSKSYYEDQIALEEKKLDLYEQEREALLKLDMTDEVAEALWEVEHAIQDSTLRMVEFRQSIIDLYVAAFDDIITAYDNKDDFLSDQQNYIEKYRELMELQGQVPDAYGYQEQIAIEEQKMADNISELNSLRQTLAEGMANGGIKEGSEEWVEMQDKIRASEEAVLDNKIAIEEYGDALKQLSVDAFDLVRNAFSNKDNFLTNQQDYIQGYADLLEAQGIDVPTEIYDELIKIEQEKRADNVANLVDARQGLADIEAKGYTAADEEWQDAYQQVVDLEKAVQDNDIAMAEYAKTIRDLDFEKFDRFIGRLDDINSEIDNLRDLYDDDDVAFEDGTWTKEGITSLGLLYQQMELSRGKSEEYAAKIEELNQAYDNGEMSEQEYYERLKDLKDGQWDAINAYEDAKDAIIDLEEARIDMIEEGIEKEISAYEDLIEVKKEELDAERD